MEITASKNKKIKCSACKKDLCEKNFSNRRECVGKDEGIECECECQIAPKNFCLEEGIKCQCECQRSNAPFYTSLLGGVAAAAAGVGITLVSGAALAVVAGASVVGAGSSVIFSSIKKQYYGEDITGNEMMKEAALGATIGAITGPIGMGASALSKGAAPIASLGIRAAGGSAAGAVSGAVVETSRKMNGEEVSVQSYAKAMGVGAVVGAVGGASSQIAGAASTKASSEVTKAATRITVQGASAAATDAGIQLYNTGEVDWKQVALNTTGQITVATTAEVSSAAVQRTSAYSNRLNNDRMAGVPKETADEIRETKKMLDNVKSEIPSTGEKVGDQNFHELKGNKAGFVAADIGPSSENGRGAGRVIFEDIHGKPVYVDHTLTHDYKAMPDSTGRTIPNPLDGYRPELSTTNLNLFDDDDYDNDEKEHDD